MRLSASEFRSSTNKRVSLFGMSGVGKSTLASRLPRDAWFHYSADYRIGTRYLEEEILDNIKSQCMRLPFVRDLLRSDSIYIRSNLTIDNLAPLSTFLGKLGDPNRGGLSLPEFQRRQALHHDAETQALLDVPKFIDKAARIYDLPHFLVDAGGSVCELDAPEVLDCLTASSVVLYIRTSDQDEAELIERARLSPKPLYYRSAFLETHLAEYLRDRQHEYIAEIDPDDFVRWVFPKLFAARLPRYEQIAAEHAYAVSTNEVRAVRDEADFIELVCTAIDRHPTEPR
ncbi:MAG: ATPase [Pseudomonadota bacterium]